MKKLLLSIMSLMAMNGAMAQTPVGDNDLANAYATQTITGRIAVHDPSIVMDVTGSTTNPKYYIYGTQDRKSTRLNSSHSRASRMPSSA